MPTPLLLSVLRRERSVRQSRPPETEAEIPEGRQQPIPAGWRHHALGDQLHKAHLGGGTVSRFDFGPKEIVRAKARIAQDVERMRAVDEYGREGMVEAFTPCGQERVCAGCIFQGVCPKE